jgi:hypothetical protein
VDFNTARSFVCTAWSNAMNTFSHKMLVVCLLTVLTGCVSPDTKTSQHPSDATTEISSVITPAAQLQKPDQVLAEVNKNYKETITDCREYGSNKPRGHYYCSGVTLRAVEDGNFNPWMYSPTSIAIGATSYSWLRRGVIQTRLYHPAGFILRNRIDAISHGLPGLESGFICLYPYDASTSTTNGHQGCGYRGKQASPDLPTVRRDDNSSYAWGSCEGMGITTATQWDQHFQSVGLQKSRQCSWNVDSQHGWNNMIASRGDFPQLQTVWNEILLNNYGDGAQMPKYIAAYFYDVSNTGALATARNFQVKMNNAGYNVPILRLNFANAGGDIFSYSAADQAVAQ